MRESYQIATPDELDVEGVLKHNFATHKMSATAAVAAALSTQVRERRS